ncbi:zinc finger protein 597 isoform X1 [Heterocephalus glaber]|uniref:Zinc finger protein 597 n=2 Tax=Heterocephalus glaber TaxID=10181 RepID=A0A0P6K6S8_HETGA|nr:zinc finger protein 597 isoform X1 [Heterocephalus glaber]XP_004864802.1 zinc finger protein 597 isoform X1 [Heterocephalus glaber]XP_004864803.1 zinc finger protein 597 isoform X1 [Heterocephalus glaber]XP_021100054.1 zinc finger protein 597 isoform X1 [Heterocephalus glaber]
MKKRSPTPEMASTLPTSDAQEPILFDDLAVYFSQEECVNLNPAQKSLTREATQECSNDVTLMGGESNTEINEQLSLESLELEQLSLENYSIAAPEVHSQRSSEDGVGIPERKKSGGTSTYKKKLMSLLVTIENHTPLVELSQCLGVRSLSEILEFPLEEAKNEYKCPECDQSFSDTSYLALHQKIHSGEKKYKCDDCGKTFSHSANLRTHRRIHTGEKPYKCTRCGTTFRQQSHLSRHMNSHIKEKPYTCDICGRSFMWLPGLAQHQKSHAAEKEYDCAHRDKSLAQKTNLALHENTHTPAIPQYQHTQCMKNFKQPSYPALPEKSHKEDSEQYNIDDENFFSFSRFKPLQCPECDLKFPCFSELVSHQNIHIKEKPYKCEMCAQSFALDSELACHQKSHRQEYPFKCSVCGKSFKANMHLVTHKRTHRKKTL